MRALITGGRGFVGTHLAAHLRECGDDVVVIDIEHDVSDAAEMGTVVADAAPDVVYHLAAISHVGSSWDDPTSVLRVNVLGTGVLLATLRRHQPDATVLFVSSAEVYGAVSPELLPLDEDSATAPTSPYAASKLAAEVVARQAFLGYGQPVVIARAFNHIGPGQAPSFFVPAIATRLVQAHRQNLSQISVGNLSTRRDFTDVRDVVRAYRLLAQSGVRGEVYNVASGVDRSMEDIAAALRDTVDPTITFVKDQKLMRPSDVPILRGNFDKLKAATSWKPEIEFATTLADVLTAVQSGMD